MMGDSSWDGPPVVPHQAADECHVGRGEAVQPAVLNQVLTVLVVVFAGDVVSDVM